MAALGPALGRRLLAPPRLRFFPDMFPFVHPEPTEHARFLIALAAPALLAALTTWLARRPVRIAARAGRRLETAAQGACVAALVACFAIQWTYRFTSGSFTPRVRYFLVPSLLAAAAVAAAVLAGVRSPAVRARFARWTVETPARRACGLLVAVVAVVLMLLPALVTDASQQFADPSVVFHLQFTFDETMAVLDGRSPLGDFAAQYASLWPYAAAVVLRLAGVSLLAFTGFMATLTATAMLALLDVLRRLTRSTTAALLLFLPLLATSAFRLHGDGESRFSLVNYFGTMPLRYAGPFLLAWLLARHLDRARPRHAWPLLLASGLCALNNVDFGVPALVATAIALAWARLPLTRAALGALAREAAIGLAGALALVAALLLVRTGRLPDFSLLVSYARVYAQAGFTMEPIRPLVGLSTIVFFTHLAALGTATARALRREPDRLLTGMLAWSGLFGLGAGAYYVGHSIPEVLTNLFPSWALSLVLLTLVVVRRLARAEGRRPALAELACLFAFGLLVCSLAQTPRPWTQLARLERHGYALFRAPPEQAFVAAHVRRGERVALLTQLGHRIAYDAAVEDVTPGTGVESIKTREQLDDLLGALRRAHGTKVFLALEPQRSPLASTSLPGALARRGLRLRAHAAGGALQLWTLD